MPNTTGNGLFFGGGLKLLLAQLTGVVSVGIFVAVSSLIFWNIIKATVGMRVPPEEEIEGLDIGEHGILAYPEFQPSGEAPPMASRSQASAAVLQGRLATEIERP
jgi:Amt family ammonium transporter